MFGDERLRGLSERAKHLAESDRQKKEPARGANLRMFRSHHAGRLVGFHAKVSREINACSLVSPIIGHVP